MGYSQHPQPTLSSETCRGSGLPYPTCGWGKWQAARTYPLCEAAAGRGLGESTAILPQHPQFN